MAVEEVGEAHGAVGMPQLDPGIYPNLIFWLIVALGALYLILSRIALPRIGTVLLERNEAISNDLETAAALKRRAEEAEAAYEASLAKAREEARKISAANKAQIDKELSLVMAKADAEIAAKSAESAKRIAEIQVSATESVSEVARETAPAIVEALLPGAAGKAALNCSSRSR